MLMRKRWALPELEDLTLSRNGIPLGVGALLRWAAEENGFPIYLKLPVRHKGALAGMAVSKHGSDGEFLRLTSLDSAKADAYVRINDLGELSATADSLDGSETFETVGVRHITRIALDHRYPMHDRSELPFPRPHNEDMGLVSPREWYVFRDDLERLGVEIDTPVITEVNPPRMATDRSAKDRDEKIWLHVAVTVLAREWVRKKARHGSRYADRTGTIIKDSLAQKIAWISDGSRGDVDELNFSPSTFTKVLADGQKVLEGKAAETTLTTGIVKLKTAMDAMSKAVYPDHPEDARAEKILSLIAKAAPDFEVPPVSLVADRLKGG